MTVLTRALSPFLHSREYANQIQDALNAQDAANIRRVVLTGEYDLTESLIVPDHCEIEGDTRNGALVRVPAGSTFPVFELDGKTGVSIRNLQGGKLSGSALSSTAYLVWIHGDSSDILIEDVLGDAFMTTVQIGFGTTGDADGTVSNVVLRHVKAINSPSIFGFTVDDAENVLLDSCHAEANHLDGYKIRRNAKWVTLRDCVAKGNGVGAVADGVDAYAGGNTLRILGGDYSEHSGNGVTIKTDTFQATDLATYGPVHKGGIRDAIARDNGGSGFGVYSFYSGPSPAPSPDEMTDATTPLIALYSLADCHAEGNANYGFLFNGLGIVGSNLIAIENGLDGFHIGQRSLFTTLNSPVAMGNSQTTTNTRYGIYIADGADYITINDPVSIGAYAEGVKTLAEIAALTPTQKTGIYVEDTADHVLIDHPLTPYNVQAQGVQTWGGSGKIQTVHHRPGASNASASHGGVGAFGGIGSTWIRSDPTLSANAIWRKTSGLPNQPTVGWTFSPGCLIGQKTWDPGSIANGAQETTTVTVTGAALGDVATVSFGRDLQGMRLTAYVSTTNTVTVVLANGTGGALDLISGTLSAVVLKVV